MREKTLARMYMPNSHTNSEVKCEQKFAALIGTHY